MFADLAGVCAKCESKNRCEEELYPAGADEHEWDNYCPNAANLSALATLPWFGKARTKATT